MWKDVSSHSLWFAFAEPTRQLGNTNLSCLKIRGVYRKNKYAVYKSQKVGDLLRKCEQKNPMISKSLIVYEFRCAYDMRMLGIYSPTPARASDRASATRDKLYLQAPDGYWTWHQAWLISCLGEMFVIIWVQNKREYRDTFQETLIKC